MKNKVYKTILILGFITLGASFFIHFKYISLLSIGYIFIGLACGYNYYFNTGKMNQKQYWWQDVLAIWCILAAIYYQFFQYLDIGWLLIAINVVLLIIKKNLYENNNRIKKKRF